MYLCCRGASIDADEASQLRYSNQQRAAAGAFDHLRSLKDVFTVNLTPNLDRELQQQQQQQQLSAGVAVSSSSSSGQKDAQTGSGSSSGAAGSHGADVPLWVCPVTLLPCGVGKQQFSALKSCGHVISDKALAAIGSADRTCPVCGEAFGSKDVVQINGSLEHMEAVRQQLKAKAAAKAAAKEARAAEEGDRHRKRVHAALEGGSSCAVRAIKSVSDQHPQQPQQQAEPERLLLTGCTVQGNSTAAAASVQPQHSAGGQARPPKAARVHS
jgi:rubredoxin